MNAEAQTSSAKRMDPAAFTGMLYLALLAANLPLVGPLRAHDVLAPVMVGFFLLRFRELGRLAHPPDIFLSGFGILAVVATLTHLHGILDVYELGVFGYMGLLYLFFSRTRFESRHLWHYAIAVGVALWLVGAYQLGAGGFGAHEIYRESTLSFLVTRYRFTFDNPNLFGSFVALPLACALVALAEQKSALSTGLFRKRVLLIGALYGPALLLSASRHVLLSVGLLLGWISAQWPAEKRLRLAAWSGFIVMAALFYLTILFPFFPLQPRFPFVNCRTTGMYTIHQAAYGKMVGLDPSAFLFGIGRSHVHALYPTLVDPAAARRILRQYNMAPMLNSFLSYMDAHCEYLNLATAFGVPAMIACYTFLIALAGHARRRGSGAVARMIVYAVAGIAVISLWDDILSKRWIWGMLGILGARTLDTKALSAPPRNARDEAAP